MKRLITAALSILMASATFAQNTTTATPTGSDSLSYAIGVVVTHGIQDYLKDQKGIKPEYFTDFIEGFKEGAAENIDPKTAARMAGWQIAEQLMSSMLPNAKKEFTDTPDSIVLSYLVKGFADGVAGTATMITAENADSYIKAKEEYNKAAKEKKLSQPGLDFLAKNKKAKKVITTASGLQYKVLVKGKGEVPQTDDEVLVNYEGRLIDGTVFDASSKHSTEPSKFKPSQVIKGWQEALTMMPVGSKWQVYIPYNLAYGEKQAGNIPPYSTLIFDIELVGINKAQPAPEKE